MAIQWGSDLNLFLKFKTLKRKRGILDKKKQINLENPLRCKELSKKGDRKIFRGFKTIE